VALTQEAVIKVRLDDNRATAGLSKLDKSVNKTVDAGKLLKGTFIALGSAAVLSGIARISKATISAASDFEETASKFGVVFSSISDQAEEAAEKLEESFGLSSQTSRQLLSDTGDLLTGFGFTQDAALGLSQQVNELAVDLASFTNFSGGAEGASQALTKALLGERESIKSLGIAITEADIKQLAEDNGVVGELTRQQKAALTLELAIRQSKNAIGDFARTQEGFANQTRLAGENVEDLKIALGNALLPAATTVISKAINPFLEGLTKWVNKSVVATRATKALAKSQDEWVKADYEALIKKRENNIDDLTGQITRQKNELDRLNSLGGKFSGGEALRQLEIQKTSETLGKLNGDLRTEETILSRLKVDLQEVTSRHEDMNTELDTTDTITENLVDNIDGLSSAYKTLTLNGKETYANSLSVAEAMEELNKRYADIQEFDYEPPVTDEDIDRVYSIKNAFDVLADSTLNAKQKAIDFTEQLVLSEEFAGTLKNGYVESFNALGAAIVSGEDASKSFAYTLAKSGLEAIATVLQGFAIEAGARTIGALAARDFSGAALWGSAAAAAGTGAGAVRAIPIPELAEGGIIPATPGGRIVKVAEAGQAEAVIPLNKMNMGGNTTIINNYQTNVAGSVWQKEALVNEVTRGQQIMQRGY
jgi:hypothetical protein